MAKGSFHPSAHGLDLVGTRFASPELFTDAFRNLRHASADEYPQVFQGALRNSYADIFAVLVPCHSR